MLDQIRAELVRIAKHIPHQSGVFLNEPRDVACGDKRKKCEEVPTEEMVFILISVLKEKMKTKAQFISVQFKYTNQHTHGNYRTKYTLSYAAGRWQTQ